MQTTGAAEAQPGVRPPYIWVKAAFADPGGGVERADRVHLVATDGESSGSEILVHAVQARGLGDHHVAGAEVPGEHNLGRGHRMLCGQGGNRRDVQVSAAPQWAVSLNRDPVGAALT